MDQGSLIGAYTVLERLGAGGMGVVYRARHVRSDRIVALKTVRLQAPWWLECIRREIHALTRLRHPGVVRILDDGVHEGKPWYAMELLEGETLRNYIDRTWSRHRRLSVPRGLTEEVSVTEELSMRTMPRPFAEPLTPPVLPAETCPPAAGGDLPTALRMFRRVCATLAFLHGEGFINCDLKPENILLVQQEPILIDFGLIAHSLPRETIEHARTMAGTLPYMSPEQIRGEFVDARADLYSLGCMLYELLVGQPPFVGPPLAVRDQHLSGEPIAPSARVTGVPAELDEIVHKLMRKELTDRAGFADEIAAGLASLCGETSPLPNFPPAKPYLYRPRFVGRSEVMARLVDARERAASGSGAFVLISGESGVGKTRVAMEMTRIPSTSPMQVITSEVSPTSIEGAASAASAPLQALRPLLRAVADRCQVGGAEVTDRLLGPARAVLARYEPLLADVPVASHETPSLLPLSAEASRRQLFECLAMMLSGLAADLPLVWIIDDIGWADELSLAFLGSLTPAFFRKTPLLILSTHRSEDDTERLDGLLCLPHIERHRLSRLANDAVRSIVGDMLALREPEQELVDFVATETEGNPFFVAEYLRAAVNEQLLRRDKGQRWHLSVPRASTRQGLARLGLPGSLRALIEQRLRRLSAGALEASIAAAVLGREADTDTLRDVVRLGDDAFIGAVDELLRRQVLEQLEPGRLSFAHDKLRETAHSLADATLLERLHGRAARALETRHGHGPDPSQHWPALGHHFAAAKMHRPAATYLRRAADQAHRTHANDDAQRLYREAIAEIAAAKAGELLPAPAPGEDGEAWQAMLLELNEGLGDVLALTGRRDEARAAYGSALASADETHRTANARLHRKVGKTWETEHQHVAALDRYARAIDAVGGEPATIAPEERNEWIQAHIERLWSYYWLARVDDMTVTAERIEPIIRQHGGSAQRGRFFLTRALALMRRDRYVIGEETLSLARAAVDSAKEQAGSGSLPMAHFVLGLALLLGGALEASRLALSQAETLARRTGDAPHLARCLTYLGVNARFRGRIAEAKAYSLDCARVSTAADIREYYAAALANQAWAAQKEHQPDVCEPLARQAMSTWASLALVYPFQYLALLPLIQVELSRGHLDAAMQCAAAIMAPTQQHLRGPGAEALASATAAWAEGSPRAARDALEAAVGLLDPDPSDA